jgi:putative Holliday junction resolvase
VTTAAGPATVLAFDFGTRRIGVAVGNTLTRTAQPLTTIDAAADDARLAAIGALVAQWQPTFLVVGVPVHADGTPHAMTVRARRFAGVLRQRFALPVRLADERYTTQAAQSAVTGMGRAGRAHRDEAAAQLILQGWFDDGGA